MNPKLLAKHLIDTITPYLLEFLDPGSLSWFDTSNKDEVKRKQAEEYWKIILSSIATHPEIMALLKQYALNPQNQKIRDATFEKFVELLEVDIQLFRALTTDSFPYNNSLSIGGNVTKSNVVIGNNNTVTNYSVSVGNTQNVIINQGGANRKAQIQDVGMNLILPNGKYPTFYWLDRSGVYSILGEKSWWEPQGYSYDILMNTLIDEINKWTNNSWEIIENDLGKLWVYDEGYHERYLTYLTRLAAPMGTVIKHYRRYKGAQFHVRQFI